MTIPSPTFRPVAQFVWKVPGGGTNGVAETAGAVVAEVVEVGGELEFCGSAMSEPKVEPEVDGGAATVSLGVETAERGCRFEGEGVGPTTWTF